MKKILIVSGHPDLNDSFANKTILEETRNLLPEAEFVYLDKLYPDFRIDVQAEQERLLRANRRQTFRSYLRFTIHTAAPDPTKTKPTNAKINTSQLLESK